MVNESQNLGVPSSTQIRRVVCRSCQTTNTFLFNRVGDSPSCDKCGKDFPWWQTNKICIASKAIFKKISGYFLLTIGFLGAALGSLAVGFTLAIEPSEALFVLLLIFVGVIAFITGEYFIKGNWDFVLGELSSGFGLVAGGISSTFLLAIISDEFRYRIGLKNWLFMLLITGLFVIAWFFFNEIDVKIKKLKR